MKKVSLKNIQSIDVHCHPFVANQEPYSPEEFVRRLSLSVAPTQLVEGYTQKGNRPFPGMNMWVQILVKRLARYSHWKYYRKIMYSLTTIQYIGIACLIS